MLRFCSVLFLLLLSAPLWATPEVRRFDIELAGMKIGELTATRTRQDTLTHYRVESKVSLWLFVRVNVHHIQTSVYRGNTLLSSTVQTSSNRGDFSASVTWNEKHYDVKVDMYKYNNESVITDPIHFNAMRLFFDEPKDIKKALADSYGLMAPVSFLKNTYYEVDVRGERNKYYYKDGKLYRANMDNAIKNYEIILRKEEN